MRFRPSHLSRTGYGALDAPLTKPTWEQLVDYPELQKGDADGSNRAGKGGVYLAPSAGRKAYKGMVAELQRLLKANVSPEIKVDGWFGDDTKTAVAKVNAKVGEEPTLQRYTTGLNPEAVDRATWAYLYNVIPTTGASPTSSSTTTAPTASGGAAEVVESVLATVVPGATAGAPKKSVSRRTPTGERTAARLAKQKSRETWKNVALWGGIAVVGIGAVTLIVKSLGKEGT